MNLFKLKQSDDFGTDRILARAGTISVFGHDIDTPFLIPTNSDLEKLDDLRRSAEHLRKLNFQQPILEINKEFFSAKMLRNLQNSPSASERTKNQIEDICDQAKLSMFRMVTPRDIEFNDKLNGIYTETQIQAETHFILINDIKFNSKIEAFDKRMRETREYIESNHESGKYGGILGVIRLDMPTDLLKQKMAILSDNGFDGIFFLHSPYYVAYDQYLHIQKVAQDKDMWFHLSGSPPTWHVNRKTSLPHIYMHFGFDTCSIAHPRKFIVIKKGTEKRPKVKKKREPKFKKFNNKNWGLVEPSNWNSCDCPVDKSHKNSSDFIRAWNGSGLIFQALNYHNLIDGNREMQIARRFIMHKELEEYLKNKRYIAEAINRVLGKDIRQMTLRKMVD